MVGEWTRDAAVSAIEKELNVVLCSKEYAFFVRGMIRMAYVCGAIDDKQRDEFNFKVDSIVYND